MTNSEEGIAFVKKKTYQTSNINQMNYSQINQDIDEPVESHSFPVSVVKSLVLGGLDGLITSFAIISGAAGGGLSWSVVLILGSANLISSSLATGLNEYFSSKAHKEFIKEEKRRETWQLKNFKDREINEMISRYESRGMSRNDAEIIVKKMASYEDFFVNLMIAEEIGASPSSPTDDEASLLTDAVLMALSYFLVGFLPLVVYLFAMFNLIQEDNDVLFLISAVITLILVLLLGAGKATFSTSSWFYSVLETCFIVCICSLSAYGVGGMCVQIFSSVHEDYL